MVKFAPVNYQLNFQTHNYNWLRHNLASQLDFDHGCSTDLKMLVKIQSGTNLKSHSGHAQIVLDE